MLASAACCPVAADAQVNAEQVLAIGRNVLSMEDYMLSIQYFNQAIKAKPYLADPYFFRGIAKLSLEDYKGAEEDCSLAIERNRFKTEAYKVRGFARQQLGKDSLAIADYNKGLEYDPTDRQFLFYKAVAQTELKDYDGADSTFTVLLRQHPRFYDGMTARAHMKLMRSDTVGALEDIERTLMLSRAQTNPYLMKADICASRHQWGEALEAMDEAVRINPDEPDLYVNRAYLRYNNDDYFGAMADYNYAIGLQPDHSSALFNRALLRFEVRELDEAAADFSKVLALDPDNFHARYNRALVFMKMNCPAKAMPDLDMIAARYPRFYPVYYAMAHCRQQQGNMKEAVAMMHKADDIVRRYVENPDRNALDRPTISKGTNRSGHSADPDSESESDVMDRFNQLVTSSEVSDTHLAYKEKIKGRVQDRNLAVDPEPGFALSLRSPSGTLSATASYFRELDNLNQRHYVAQTIYLTSESDLLHSEDEIEETFRTVDACTAIISGGNARPVDYLIRGIAYTMLKNHDAAIADLDKTLESNPDFTVALMARGYALMQKALNPPASVEIPGQENEEMISSSKAAALAAADFDKVLRNNPMLVFAWFNKGNIYYAAGDFTSALQCYTKAIEINPDFGQAYYNRGLGYLRAGNRQAAFADLSKAGELGIVPSYNLLKRMR